MDKARYSFAVRANLLELYGTSLVDLTKVDPGSTGSKQRRNSLEIKVLSDGSTEVPNITDHTVNSAKELKELLEEGQRKRITAATRMNSDSSRSHLIFTIQVEVADRQNGSSSSGKVRLVDLAGSERAKKSGVDSEGLKELIEINKSLSALGDVIQELAKHGGSS